MYFFCYVFCYCFFVLLLMYFVFFFFSSRRRHTRYWRDWSSDVCSSDLSVAELEQARQIVDVVSVQNLYNLTNRQSQDVLDHATEHGIAFIPWFPIATGDLAAPDSPVADIARELDATPSQVALAWLLQKSPVVLPIPGTKSVEHLTENLGAARLRLSDEDMARLDALA